MILERLLFLKQVLLYRQAKKNGRVTYRFLLYANEEKAVPKGINLSGRSEFVKLEKEYKNHPKIYLGVSIE
jgi:hypothetical protein